MNVVGLTRIGFTIGTAVFLAAGNPAMARKHHCHNCVETYGPFTQSYSYESPGYSYSYSESPWYTVPESSRSVTTYGYAPPNEFTEETTVNEAPPPPMFKRSSTRLTGQVMEVKVFTLSRWDRPMAVAFVNTGDPNNPRRVILGSANDIMPLNIRAGDRFSVSGASDMVDGEPVVIANSFRAREIRWSTPVPGSTFAAADLWYNGTILDEHHKNINGTRHTLVSVRLDDGSRSLVDLGPSSLLPRKLDIDNGDPVTFFGRTGFIDGRNAIIASQFNVNGTSVRLNFEPAPFSNYGYR